MIKEAAEKSEKNKLLQQLLLNSSQLQDAVAIILSILKITQKPYTIFVHSKKPIGLKANIIPMHWWRKYQKDSQKQKFVATEQALTINDMLFAKLLQIWTEPNAKL